MDESIVTGDTIRITYLGKEKKYHNYKVEKDEQEDDEDEEEDGALLR